MSLKNEGKLEQFLDIMNEQFGFYLDCVVGFKQNFSRIKKIQQKASKLVNKSIGELDRLPIAYSKYSPVADLTECKKLEQYRTSQAKYKKNNSHVGRNYRLALYNCLCSILNEWNTFKKDVLKKWGASDKDLMPVFCYLRGIRDRLTHADEKSSKRIVKPYKLSYVLGRLLPGFEAGDKIELLEDNLGDIIIEVRMSILEKL